MMPKFVRDVPGLKKTDIAGEWYKNASYEDAKELVKENLYKTVSSFIAAGYWLKYIRDNRSYEKDGYRNLWECAESEFGLKVSEASRAMSMNDKYSVDGNSPSICDSFKNYNKSQLQEMLTMSDEQIEQVTPDMSIKDIRKIKNPDVAADIAVETEEPAVVEESIQEAAGVTERCDVATDLVNTESEEELQDEIEGDILTEIEEDSEQDEELSVEFNTDELMQELEDANEDETVDEEDYAEFSDMHKDSLEDIEVIESSETECNENGTEEITIEGDDVQETEDDDYTFLTELLEKEKDMLNHMIHVNESEPLPVGLMRKQKLIVAALANMKCDLEELRETENNKISEKIKKDEIIRYTTDMEMVESLNAAWQKMARRYSQYPDEGMRCAMNILTNIISEVKSEAEERHRKRWNIIIAKRQQA